MSGRVGVEQTPDMPTAWDLHVWLREHGGGVDEFDWEAIRDLLDTFLAPVLDAAVREARAAELREEWGHRYPDGSILADSSEVVARSRALMAKIDGRPLELMVRHVTAWDRADRIAVDAPEGGA